MKRNAIYLIGLLSSMSASIGFGLLVVNQEIGRVPTLVGTLIFGLLFLPLLYWHHGRLRQDIKFITGMAAALTLSFSILFKVLHFPGANILLLVSTGIFALVFLPMVFLGKMGISGKGTE